MGQVEQMVEEPVAPSGGCHSLAVRQKPVAQIGKHASGYLLRAYGQIVELGTRDRQQDEDDVIGEKRGQHHEGGHLELMVALEEIIEVDDEHQREIADVAQTHQFGEPAVGHRLREKQRGLTAEDGLLGGGEQVVEVGQHPVQLVGVGIPPRQEHHLHHDAYEHKQSAGVPSVDEPGGQRGYEELGAQP